MSFRPLSKPRYRWSQDACRWVLQGAHRLTPPKVWPSNLRPQPPRYDGRGLYINPIKLGRAGRYDA